MSSKCAILMINLSWLLKAGQHTVCVDGLGRQQIMASLKIVSGIWSDWMWNTKILYIRGIAANDPFPWRCCTIGRKEIIFPVLQPGRKVAAQQLTFVVSTNRHQRTDDSRRTVRSHVMQNYRRSKILQNAKASSFQRTNSSQPLPRTAAEWDGETQTLRRGSEDSVCPNCGGLKTGNLNFPNSLFKFQELSSHLTNVSSNGHIDPFGALPVNAVQGSQLLLNHGNYIISFS